MRLLIVEDERAIAEVMMLNLKRVGYECEYAQDGEMGAAMVEKQSYDLVLLDIMLPKINGYELMEYLAQLQIPVIFITAKGSVQDRVKGLHMGADDYLVNRLRWMSLRQEWKVCCAVIIKVCRISMYWMSRFIQRPVWWKRRTAPSL